jgi:hypothetical protein
MLPWGEEELTDCIERYHGERLYLNVPKKHYKKVKSLGAHWDPKCPREDGFGAKHGKWYASAVQTPGSCANAMYMLARARTGELLLGLESGPCALAFD